MITEKKACVIGWPISHSRSPMIHGYWLNKYNISGSYTKLAVEPEKLPDFISSLRAGNYIGCNITIPHKEAAFQLSDIKHEAAMAVGAANTLWVENGQVHATNTDTYGFMTHLNTSASEWNNEKKPVVVLGAGGAAKAIIYGLLEEGVSEVRIINRTKKRAEKIKENLSGNINIYDLQETEKALSGAQLLINTTSLGMIGSDKLEIDLSPMSKDSVVSDIVYAPLKTDLLLQAERKNFKTVDGLGMLLHQAVPGFETWFGTKPEVTQELRDIVISDLGEH